MNIAKVEETSHKLGNYDLSLDEVREFLDIAHKDGKLDINAVFNVVGYAYAYGFMRGQNSIKNRAKKKA